MLSNSWEVLLKQKKKKVVAKALEVDRGFRRLPKAKRNVLQKENQKKGNEGQSGDLVQEKNQK